MSVQKILVFGNTNVGVYFLAGDEYVLAPVGLPEKVLGVVEETLGVEVLEISVSGSPLLGVLAAGNSNGLLVSRYVYDSEFSALRNFLKKFSVNVEIFPGEMSAVGNLVLANDKAIVVSEDLSRRDVRFIEDVLGVEAVPMSIGGSTLVGSIAYATNRGVLVYPLADEDEISRLEEIFGTVVDVGTVNKGSIFVKAGVVANSRGALVGFDTTGPELMRIQQVFFH